MVSQAALPFLPEDGTGRIINVTSAAGLVGTIGQVNYGAAKAAIVGMTKSLVVYYGWSDKSSVSRSGESVGSAHM